MEHGDKVSPKPSLLKAEQTEFSQTVLIWQASQSLDHISGPSLDPLHKNIYVYQTSTDDPFIMYNTQAETIFTLTKYIVF